MIRAMSMVFGYTPPVGFGGDVANDPTKKKAQPGDPGYIDSSIGAGAVGGNDQGQLPGVAPVSTYTRSVFDPQGIDLSQPFQLAQGSRDADLMSDAGYQQLLASLGLDEQTARANVTFGQTAAQNQLTSGLSDLARQSQEDRYGIDATLRSRGANRGSQREALQARAMENEGRTAENLRSQTADKIAGLNQQLADTISQLRRAQATGAGDAAGRLQQQRDALLAQIAQQQAQDAMAAQSAQQNQAVLAQLAAMQQSAQNAPGLPPAPTQDDVTRARLEAMTPEEQAAFRQFVTAQAAAPTAPLAPAPALPAAPAAPAYSPGPAYNPAPAAPPPNYRPAPPPPLTLSKPKQPLTPIRGKY